MRLGIAERFKGLPLVYKKFYNDDTIIKAFIEGFINSMYSSCEQADNPLRKNSTVLFSRYSPLQRGQTNKRGIGRQGVTF